MRLHILEIAMLYIWTMDREFNVMFDLMLQQFPSSNV